jgi:hypothetical protein
MRWRDDNAGEIRWGKSRERMISKHFSANEALTGDN